MHDALAVRGIQGIDDLQRVFTRRVERQRPSQRSAFHELHDQVVGPDVVERADVGMIQRRNGTRFADESLAELSRRRP